MVNKFENIILFVTSWWLKQFILTKIIDFSSDLDQKIKKIYFDN